MLLYIPTDNSEQHYIYKEFENCKNDLYFFPPTKKLYDKAPVLFMMPGGGWNRNNAMSMYNMAMPVNNIVRENGFAVATISYRGCTNDGASMSEEVADVLDGVAFLAKYRNIFEIDPMRVYTLGHSAGAHLSLTVAYMDRNCVKEYRTYPDEQFDFKGVIGFSAPTTFMPDDMYLYYLEVGYMNTLFPAGTNQEFAHFSPLYLAEQKSVPTFLAHGDEDQLVDCKHSIYLFEKLKEKGQKAQLILCRGGDHSFQSLTGGNVSPTYPEAAQKAAEFLLSLEG